ncbi:MAG: hypothetical protein UR98_C0022G0013 [Parcubacteria group bacterium GW2011_GWA1_36_12]|nr:MAG: hypothetical protein UR98_C0022G0013 [Parcubacteria group bacterium GW2011_GWA1_36_12]
MKTLILIVILVSVLALPVFAYDWVTNPTNGHRYALTDTPILQPTWVEAEAEAVSLGGHLATIRNLADEQWLKTTYGTDWLWIGLNDVANLGSFVWTSGEPVSYINWNPLCPSSTNGPCNGVGYNIGVERGWNDFPDWYRLYGIIELQPVPEPSSLLALCGGVVGFLAFRRQRK